MAEAARPQLTSLLSNETLARAQRMRLMPRCRFTNRSRGEHTAAQRGSSNEFKDYRDYAPGDDIRSVDWNIFARLHRPYIKLFHEEEEMHVVLLMDASASMAFDGKLDLARQLAAGLGMMGLAAVERVSVQVFNQADAATDRLAPCTGLASLRSLFRFLESVDAGGSGPLENGIEAMLRRHRGRGVVVILSDFLTTGDLRRAFNLLYRHGLELFAIQILAPSEIDPEIKGDLRLVDSETGITLDISSVEQLLGLYQEHRLNHQRQLEELCQKRGGRFLSIASSESADVVLFDLLRRKGWVR